MALLPQTGLESTPDGTTGIAAIINANWIRLEAILGPVLNRAITLFTQSVSTVPLDFSDQNMRKITLTQNTVVTTSNLVAGGRMTAVFLSGGTGRGMSFPAGWTFVGSASITSFAANKTALLELWSTTTADAGVVARWTVQP